MLSDLVVCYLFLAAPGRGSPRALGARPARAPFVLVNAPGVHLHPSAAYRKLLGSGLVAAFVLLALGIVCLVADLGNAERMILLLVHPTASYLAVARGRRSLPGARGGARPRMARRRRWNVALYASFMWSPGLRPSWSWYTAFAAEPRRGALVRRGCALFAAPSLSCGIACACACSDHGRGIGVRRRARRLAAVDAAVIVVEAAIVAVFVYAASQAGAPLSNGTEPPRRNRCGSWWRAGTRSCSGAASSYSAWRCRSRWTSCSRRLRPLPGAVLFASACVLVGGFVMRFCVVAAGAHPVLSSMG
ncbi:MAG: polysulfide reductase [Eggerthellaceae bacterium]